MTTITETYTGIGTEIATAIDTCIEANANAGTAIVVGGAMDTAEDWLTRPRIGQLVGRNEQTIDRDIKRHGFESRSLPNGTKLFRVSDFIRIGRIKATDIPNGLTAGQAVEVLRRLCCFDGSPSCGKAEAMRRNRRARPPVQAPSAFAGFRFPPDVILLAVRWYLR